jgi:hypothetical protein
MTEIPEHLLKRAQAARDKADDPSGSRIPKHLLARAREVRGSSYRNPSSIDPDDLFGMKRSELINEDETTKRQRAVGRVAEAIALSTAFVADNSPVKTTQRAMVTNGDYKKFGIAVNGSKKDHYINVRTLARVDKSVSEFGVGVETNSHWQIPIHSKESEKFLNLGGGVIKTLKNAVRLGKDGYLNISDEFFADADFVAEVLARDGASRKTAKVEIYPGDTDFDETYRHRYGFAVCLVEGGYDNRQPVLSSAVLPDIDGKPRGFNTAISGTDSLWPGYTYAGNLGLLSYQRGSSEPRLDTTIEVADNIASLIRIFDGGHAQQQTQQAITEQITQRIIPLVER